MPVALPLPFAPSVDMCVKLFNIHTPGYNLFMCMDFETRIAKAPVLVLHFDCMQMGADGIHLQKPEDSLTTPAIEEEDGETPSTGDIEVYDEVYEENKKNKSAGAVGKPKMWILRI